MYMYVVVQLYIFVASTFCYMHHDVYMYMYCCRILIRRR